jgi:hypothetical protein
VPSWQTGGQRGRVKGEVQHVNLSIRIQQDFELVRHPPGTRPIDGTNPNAGLIDVIRKPTAANTLIPSASFGELAAYAPWNHRPNLLKSWARPRIRTHGTFAVGGARVRPSAGGILPPPVGK